METFSALLTICAGNSPVPGEFPKQRSVTRSFDDTCSWINGWVNNGEAGDWQNTPKLMSFLAMIEQDLNQWENML